MTTIAISSSCYYPLSCPQDWRRRYFLLKGSKLFYAKNEWSPAHGMIDLAHCTTVKSADLKAKKRHSFEVSTPEITYLLYADTEQEKDDWIGRVGKAIVRCSSTYYNSNNNAASGVQGNASAAGGGGGPYRQQPGMSSNSGSNNPYFQGDDDDDDVYYEDPNNPNPYFND
jgi:PH domain